MGVKMHFLYAHVDYFPENLGNYNKEYGERFHQNIREMERRYQGKWDANMKADYCWMLKRYGRYETGKDSHCIHILKQNNLLPQKK